MKKITAAKGLNKCSVKYIKKKSSEKEERRSKLYCICSLCLYTNASIQQNIYNQITSIFCIYIINVSDVILFIVYISKNNRNQTENK